MIHCVVDLYIHSLLLTGFNSSVPWLWQCWWALWCVWRLLCCWVTSRRPPPSKSMVFFFSLPLATCVYVCDMAYDFPSPSHGMCIPFNLLICSLNIGKVLFQYFVLILIFLPTFIGQLIIFREHETLIAVLTFANTAWKLEGERVSLCLVLWACVYCVIIQGSPVYEADRELYNRI